MCSLFGGHLPGPSNGRYMASLAGLCYACGSSSFGFAMLAAESPWTRERPPWQQGRPRLRSRAGRGRLKWGGGRGRLTVCVFVLVSTCVCTANVHAHSCPFMCVVCWCACLLAHDPVQTGACTHTHGSVHVGAYTRLIACMLVPACTGQRAVQPTLCFAQYCPLLCTVPPFALHGTAICFP